MIRDVSVVREPRGISWQNWTATCKGTLLNNGKYIVLGILVMAAIIGGGLYVRHTKSGNLAKQSAPPAPAGEKVNLNTVPSTVPAVTDNSKSGLHKAASGTPASDGLADSTHKTPLPAAICDLTARKKANTAYESNLSVEKTLHATQLALLGVTDSVTSLLGLPNATKVAAENSRHQNVLGSLASKLDSQLAAAHCD